MILLYHDSIKPIKYVNTTLGVTIDCNSDSILEVLFELAKKYPDELLVWCHLFLKDLLNIDALETIFHHSLIMASYRMGNEYVIGEQIGFIDQHLFVNVNKEVCYPTWLMSSDIGGVNASVLLVFESFRSLTNNLDLFLCHVAKKGMDEGLLCYSNPQLLLKTNQVILENVKRKEISLFGFVKIHYKWTWMWVLFFCYITQLKQIKWQILLTMLFPKPKLKATSIQHILVKSTKKNISKEAFSVDVIIPTLLRAESLENVLKCLAKQTILPKNVIIVEQNPDITKKSELEFIDFPWPFKVKHTFTHQLGACNARNIALQQVTANWVFFADDDILFENQLFENVLAKINQYGTDSLVMSCPQPKEKVTIRSPYQSSHFGSGTSFVKSSCLALLTYKKEHEFGYGEDADFGMQIRNKGFDIIHFSEIQIVHLKVKIGGFRYKPPFLWKDEVVQSKPSPTVMAFNLKHLTPQQFYGYKILLYVKYYFNQPIKNPFVYFKKMNASWHKSIYWATKMLNNEI